MFIRLKSFVALLLSLMLLSFSLGVYATEAETTEISQEVVTLPHVEATKDGFYVNISYVFLERYYDLAELTSDLVFTLKDDRGTVIDTVTKSSEDVNEGILNLVFDYKDYDLGDRFTLEMPDLGVVREYESFGIVGRTSADSSSLQLEVIEESFETGYDMEEDQPIRSMSTLFSKEVPCHISVYPKLPDTVTVAIKDENGEAVKNVAFTFSLAGGKKFTKTTDGEGNVYFNIEDTGYYTVSSNDIRYSADNVKFTLTGDRYLLEVGVFNTDEETIKAYNAYKAHNAGPAENFNIVVETSALADLSPQFAQIEIELSDGANTYRHLLNLGLNNVEIPASTYSLKVVKSPYCTVKAENTVNVTDNTNISIQVEPLHFLQVEKSVNGVLEPFNFTVPNVNTAKDNVYSGIDTKQFAVIPNQVLTILDTDTNNCYTIEILNEPVTKLNLTTGTVLGEEQKASPKTADKVEGFTLIAIVVISILLLLGVFMLIKRGRMKKSQLLSLLLVATLTIPYLTFPQTEVHAGAYGELTQIGTSFGVATGFGIMDNTHPIVKVTLVPTNGVSNVCYFCKHEDDTGTKLAESKELWIPSETPPLVGNCSTCSSHYKKDKTVCSLCNKRYSEGALYNDLADGDRRSSWWDVASFYIAPTREGGNAYLNGGVVRYIAAGSESSGTLRHYHGRKPFSNATSKVDYHKSRLIRAYDYDYNDVYSEYDDDFYSLLGQITNVCGPVNLKNQGNANLITTMNSWMYDYYALQTSTLNEITEEKIVNTTNFINDYINLVASSPTVFDKTQHAGVVQALRDASATGSLALILEPMVAMTDGRGAGNCIYMTVDDILNACRDIATGLGSYNNIRYNTKYTSDYWTSYNKDDLIEMYEDTFSIKRCGNDGGNCGSTLCQNLGHLRNGPLKEAGNRRTFGSLNRNAIPSEGTVEKTSWGTTAYKPSSAEIREKIGNYKNPFGGWLYYAFFSSGTPTIIAEFEPALYVEVKARKEDKDGNLSEPVTAELPGFTKGDLNNNVLEYLYGVDINIPEEFILDLGNGADAYQPKKNQDVTITFDKVGKWNGREDTSFVPEQVIPIQPAKQLYVGNDKKIRYNYDWEYGENALETLRNENCDSPDFPASPYFKTETAAVFKVTIEMIVEPAPKIEPVPVADEVPQWRINKYFPYLHELENASLAYGETYVDKELLGISTACTKFENSNKENYFNNEGIAKKFQFIPLGYDPRPTESAPYLDKATPWFELYNIMTESGNTAYYKDITYANATSGKVGITSDLLAWKTPEIDNIVTAKWLETDQKESIAKKGIAHGFTNKIAGGINSDTLEKQKSFEFLIELVNPLTHFYHYYDHSPSGSACYCKSARYSEDVQAFIKNSAQYDSTIAFQRFVPDVQNGYTHTATDPYIENGFVSFAQQSSEPLKIYPEVPMFYSDTVGNHAIQFVVGERQREFNPVSFHTLEYVKSADAESMVTPTINSTSVATDAKATALANRLGAPEAMVANKGSGTNSAYQVKGNLVAKTYALDIDSESLKNTWGCGSYSSKAINESFLEDFAYKVKVGDTDEEVWQVDITATENLKINDNLFGDRDTETTATANENPVCETYKLTVRAGVLTSVTKSGVKVKNTEWETTLPKDVLNAIDNMALNPDGVFSCFESKTGSVLTEPEFATEAAIARENSDSIAEGTGWYSEDTTVLTLNIYTTTFALNSTVFSNKIPVSIPGAGLETPQNKSLFYSKGVKGYQTLDYQVKPNDSDEDKYKVNMHYDSAKVHGGKVADYRLNLDDYVNQKDLYIVPNVSIQDTTF